MVLKDLGSSKKIKIGMKWHFGSGGTRALQKVPKRALARVDPLKEWLLRVSALFLVLKKSAPIFCLAPIIAQESGSLKKRCSLKGVCYSFG